MIENGFEIVPYQEPDEDWEPEQYAFKHIMIGKDLCQVNIIKIESDPIRYNLYVTSLKHSINFNDYALEKSLYNLNRIIKRGDLWHIKEDQ